MPVFDGFLKDLDEVRIGVLKHLADIFKVRASLKSDSCKIAVYFAMPFKTNER